MSVAEALAGPTRDLAGAAGGVPPYVWTACTNARCGAYLVRRQVWLKQVTVGVVAVPNLLCAACASHLPLSIFQPAEEGDLMPKIHADRPPTDKTSIVPPAPAEEPAPPAAVAEPAEVEPTPEPEPEAKPAKKAAAKVVRGKASAQLEGLKDG